MALLDEKKFRDNLPSKGRLLAIDPGRKRVGLAMSDMSRFIATPFKNMKRLKLIPMVDFLQELIAKEEIVGLIMGLPLSLDGHFGPAAQGARDWAQKLAEYIYEPITLIDERLSSDIMDRFLVEKMDLSRQKRHKILDKMAASYILQKTLDAWNQ